MKPILNNATVFDARSEYTFTFVWNGGEFSKIHFIIKDYQSGEVVYQNNQTTTLSLYTLPSNVLENGKRYIAGVFVETSSGLISSVSDYILVRCFSLPTFNFSQIIVQNGQVLVQLNYVQAEGEKIGGYQIALYDSLQNLIKLSETRYTLLDTYTFENIESDKTYYLKAFGKTLYGADIDTGMVSFESSFVPPYVYSNVELENLKREGVKITSNIYALSGNFSGNRLEFDSEKGLNLTDNSHVVFNTGFNIENDFTLKLEVYPVFDKPVILIQNEQGYIELNFRGGASNGTTNEYVYGELNVVNHVVYTLLSKLVLKPSGTDRFFVYIRKKGNLFDLEIKGVS